MEDGKNIAKNYLLENTSELADFKSYLQSRGIKGQGLENNAYLRHDRFIKEFLPKILETIPNCGKRTVVELGFGQASTSHALSHAFKRVHSFEIEERLLTTANKRKEIFNLENISFYAYDPDTMLKKALEVADDSTVFVLFAVLEHMTEKERLGTLEKIWSKMGDNNYLFIGNTPNRLAYNDLHTHQHSFLFTLPNYTCLQYLKKNKDIRFAREYLDQYEAGGMEAFSLVRMRRGMGVSFHDFQIALGGDLNHYLVCGSFSKPWKLYDALLSAYFLDYNITAPICFAIRDMYFILKKNTSTEEKSKAEKYNQALIIEYKEVVASVLNEYSLSLQSKRVTEKKVSIKKRILKNFK